MHSRLIEADKKYIEARRGLEHANNNFLSLEHENEHMRIELQTVRGALECISAELQEERTRAREGTEQAKMAGRQVEELRAVLTEK